MPDPHLARNASGVDRLLLNKYYVDEIYDAVVVQPLKQLVQLAFKCSLLPVSDDLKSVGYALQLAYLAFLLLPVSILHADGL